MEPFALSVPGYRRGLHTHKSKQHDEHGNLQPDTEGSRSPTPDTHTYTQSETANLSSSISRRSSQSHIINPLSHSPDTLRQLAVAGLSPEDELPSLLHPGFPHKPLPPATSSRKRRSAQSQSQSQSQTQAHGNGELDSDGRDAGVGSRQSEQGGRHYLARIRHLNTMTAIMHRCLRDGDMPRAKRALGLLLRTRDVDIRLDNLWVIGSEILMRDGEVPLLSSSSLPSIPKPGSGAPFELGLDSSSQRTQVPDLPSYTYNTNEEKGDQGESDDNDNEEEDIGGRRRRKTQPPERWGTAANFSQVKTYLELLIQHHPYDMHRPHLTSAVDFWPALFGIEVYNLDVEFRRGMYRINLEYPPITSSSRSSSRSLSPSSSSDAADRMDLDDYDYDQEDSYTRRRRRRKNGYHQEEVEEEDSRERHFALDALRTETQRGALELAVRMDGVLENAPYSTHAELLRLRGHVSLFIADLFLPSRLVERFHRHQRRRTSLSSSSKSSSVRESAKVSEEHVALARRREEQEKARGFFRHMLNANNNVQGGRGRGRGGLEDWVLRFLDPEDNEDALS